MKSKRFFIKIEERKNWRPNSIKDRIVKKVMENPEGMTRFELAEELDIKLQTICARTNELINDGYLNQIKNGNGNSKIRIM